MQNDSADKTSEKTRQLNTAAYIRLSREDDDRMESLSVGNQRLLLTEYVNQHPELCLYDVYVDDGYTGTNFDRPDFQRMIADIEKKIIQCVVVKDLSRLGRRLEKVSEYINDYFPRKRVRFIAINDTVDKRYFDIDPGEDMMIDVKNMFNSFYPKDISKKVRSTFRAKQNKGQFIGAFASFGYVKAPDDHNRLEIDEYAAGIVRRIFEMYISGMGQNTIAKVLNDEGIPCPSEYKKECGLNYYNSNRLETTSYWTYSTIRNILHNELYIGNMVQNKNFRQMCKKNAVSLPRDEWIIVEGTHEAIIDRNTWDTAQGLLKRNTRQTMLSQNVHIFAGFLKCGDCGRAMVKIKRKGTVTFNCGSYNRYGRKFCSIHSITEQELERIVLDDLNLIIKSLKNIRQLIEEEDKRHRKQIINSFGDVTKYQMEYDRFIKKKENAYEDYSEGIITKEEYLRFREKYEGRISEIQERINSIRRISEEGRVKEEPWIERLLQFEQIEHLDRETVAEMVSMIYVYENGDVKIVYNFSDKLEILLGKSGEDSKAVEKE